MVDATPLLQIENLEIRFSDILTIDNVSLEIRSGEVFGVIGETGAGKSLTAWAAIDLLPRGARITNGAVYWKGRKLTGQPDRRLQEIRGSEISIITQNPLGALNPMNSVGAQIVKAIRAHQRVTSRQAWRMAIDELRAVGIPDPERRARSYPHQLSGGMAQRVLIAMAMVNRPQLLIADEPTTGLDVTIQAEILDLMSRLVRETGSAVWLITHDLGVIANYTERAAVMFAGQLVETAPTSVLFEQPAHPYTRGLLEALTVEDAISERLAISGPPPDLVDRPPGCQFEYRCPWADEGCSKTMPELLPLDGQRSVRCLVAHRAERATKGLACEPMSQC